MLAVILISFLPSLLFIPSKFAVLSSVFYFNHKSYLNILDYTSLIIMTAAGGALLIFQPENTYSIQHFFAFLLFILIVPLLNFLVRFHVNNLIRWLSWICLINSISGIIFFNFDIDLSSYRGLNTIYDTDGFPTRFFFESACLSIVANYSFLKNYFLKIIFYCLIFYFTVFIVKSFLIVILMLINNRSSFAKIFTNIRLSKYLTYSLLLIMLIVLISIQLILREDFSLSIYEKLFQLKMLMSTNVNFFIGNGWGYVLPEYIRNENQPFQIEMQLPMLLVQMGCVVFLTYLAYMYRAIKISTKNSTNSKYIFLIYISVGFINPWLFMPVWYLTVVLLNNSSKNLR